MKISHTAQQIETSPTRELFNLAKTYSDVIDFTLGDPDLKPHERIRAAAVAAIEAGRTRYSANAGLLDLREAVAQQIEKLYHRQVDPQSEVAITVGAMEALYLTMLATLNPGDEVILIAPYYVNYLQMARMCGANPVIIHTDASDGFALNLQKVRDAITSKTAVIVINNPCNPTGKVWSQQEVEDVARIAKEHDILVISDEVYRSLIYEGSHHSILSVPDMGANAVLVDSFSKEFCMTGWRLGYVVGNEQLISAVTRLQENVAACAPLPSQYAGIEALTNPQIDMTPVRETFRKRRDVLYDCIARIPGLACRKPAGTFYLFVDISACNMTSMAFAKRLITQEHVAVAPGAAYGEAYDHYIRLAYTMDIPMLQEGAVRIERFVRVLLEGHTV